MRTRTKFNVATDKTGRTYDGIVFDSALEMRYYRDVVTAGLKSGEIKECSLQVPFILQPSFKRDGVTVRQIRYVADFVITHADGREVVVDVKGQADNTAKLKRKLFWYKYPNIKYVWVTYVKKFGGWIDYDECRAMRRRDKKAKRDR